MAGALISENQTAFLSGRSIKDCVMLAHEIAKDFKKKSTSKVCIKVDLQKALDSVNRHFIYYVL